jgi:DNA-binding CsgD family transcriptional regulator
MEQPDPLDVLHQRRMDVLRLRRAGNSVAEIATVLAVSNATVSKDMAWLRANGHDLGGTDLVIYEDASRRARTSDKGDPSRIAELRHRIISMRLEGYQPREIAATLGCALETVQRHIAAVFNTLTAEKAEQALAIELARLDSYLVFLRPGIEMGDPKAIGQAIKVSEQRAKYQGLHAPTKTQVTNITVDSIDAEIERLTQQFQDITGRPYDVDAEVVD